MSGQRVSLIKQDGVAEKYTALCKNFTPRVAVAVLHRTCQGPPQYAQPREVAEVTA